MKLLRKYNYLIIILVFLVILYITYNSYDRTKNIIKSKHRAESRLVENNVKNTIRNAYGAYSISEKVLNDEMKGYSEMLVEKYKDNSSIKHWNLKEINKKMNDYQIYIINRDLKIVRTTFKKDLGMDFSKYPSFSNLLKKRMEGNSFVADKMDISTKTGKIKKYSYMPTPDNKYLIELSINLIERFSMLKDLNLYTLARELEKKYQSVENISFYKFNKQASSVGEINDKKRPIDTDISNENEILVKKAVSSNNTISRTIKKQKFTITHKYIPFLSKSEDGENDWWNSFVMKITYNNKKMLKEINKETNSFLISLSIIAVVFVIFISVMVFLLKKTEYLAYHDHLTGLANRKNIEKYFDEILNQNEDKLAILYIDLDKFKNVNDNYGHEFGDKILKEVGNRLKNIVRAKDKVSRVGGDEFTILLTDIKSKNDISRVVNELENKIEKPFKLEGNTIYINCSIGVSIFPDEGTSLEELINKADISMYKVKESKK